MLIIAHRGESYIAPENTLSSINLAWEKAAEAVEIDVHMTRDHKIVVSHDAETGRVCETNLVISENDADELRKLDLGKWKGEHYIGEKMPLLSEVLETVPENGKLVVEIKCGPDVLPIIRDLFDASGKRSNITIISFSLEVVTESKKMMPDIPTCWLLSPERDSETREYKPYNHSYIQTALDHGLDGFDVYYGPLTKDFVDAAKAAGLQMIIYTADDPKDVKHLIEIGVDAITTNRAQWIKEQLKLA